MLPCRRGGAPPSRRSLAAPLRRVPLYLVLHAARSRLPDRSSRLSGGGRPAAGPASSAATPYVHAFTQDSTVLGPVRRLLRLRLAAVAASDEVLDAPSAAAFPALTTRVQQGFSLLAQPTPCAMRPSVHATGIPRTVVVGFLLHPYI